jgi:hypothetical protein
MYLNEVVVLDVSKANTNTKTKKGHAAVIKRGSQASPRNIDIPMIATTPGPNLLDSTQNAFQ